MSKRSCINSFTFSSKSETLKFLKSKIKKAKIEPIFDFTVFFWNQNQDSVLKSIIKNFRSKYVIVRSSAMDEDTDLTSNAGNYDSILNVSSSSKTQIKTAILKVILSYHAKNNYNPDNKILIQNQTMDIAFSGVIFSKTYDGAPYYVINYDKGLLTNRVTKGEVNNVLKVFRNTKLPDRFTPWPKLIQAVKEIECILENSTLDIEFGIKKNNEIVIFQVRPLTLTLPKFSCKSQLLKKITNSQQKFLKLSQCKTNCASHHLFSDMADWNPAEIIGNKPKLLDYSLYDYLIMRDIWRQGRFLIGYQNVSPLKLMCKFGNKPYVDLVSSFSSMIPDNINKTTRKKLMKFYTHKIKQFPELHDKVEFEILFTCFDFSLSKRLKELLKYGFSPKEIIQLKENLVDFTNNVIGNFQKVEANSLKDCSKMIENRKKILEQNKHKTVNYILLLKSAEKLLHDCKLYGTKNFSTIARIAFIASILLKSMVAEKKITASVYDRFLESLTTPVTELQRDFTMYMKKSVSFENLLKKYGHLRPGTYDITATRYDKNPELLSSPLMLKSQKSETSFKEPQISKFFSKEGLLFTNIDFFSFARRVLSSREYLKFEFTHNLSDALELIAEAAKILGFSRDDVSYLDIDTIFSSYKKLTKTKLQKIWKEKIRCEKNAYFINNAMNLPPFISSKKDFELFSYFSSRPNFITQKSVNGETVVLGPPDSKEISQKIIMIENADPGYDWIFTKNIIGLVTKYGGVASHMAIRCSELGIPAAIGCGELLYNKLLDSKKILLDCANRHIIVLEHQNMDRFFEEKKMLKSLGYIK